MLENRNIKMLFKALDLKEALETCSLGGARRTNWEIT